MDFGFGIVQHNKSIYTGTRYFLGYSSGIVTNQNHLQKKCRNKAFNLEVILIHLNNCTAKSMVKMKQSIINCSKWQLFHIKHKSYLFLMLCVTHCNISVPINWNAFLIYKPALSSVVDDGTIITLVFPNKKKCNQVKTENFFYQFH